jgi:hypothetical protein
MNTRLWYYEFCDNNHGLWSREWFATEAAAAEDRETRIADLGDAASTGVCDGSYGDVDVVQSVEIELTDAGALAFANNWGTGS